MAFVLADRVKETTTSPGTGTATLNGAAAGYQSFSAGIGASNTTYYTIADQSGSNWEVGYGTIGAGGTTLARTTVLASSNSGSLVNFSSGTQDVWCDYAAKKAVIQDSNGVVTTPVLNVTSTTSTTPNLTFNASNSGFTSGASVSGSYLQTVIQNKSGTAGASTNYVLSNDLGTDSTYYGEFGMNSSVYSSGTPSDFFSLNNGIYFSGHDGDITLGSGNGQKTYMAWGTTGNNAHVINASGALGLSTNLGTTPALSGTTGYGTSGQVLTSGGSTAAPTWSTNISGNAANVTGIVAGANGGTGVANTGSTITLGGSVTYSGAYTQTWTRTANSSLTLPSSGTVLASVTAPATNPVSGTPSSSTYLRGDGTWATISAGSPGGSNTQVQYNSSGSFAGSANFTFDGTNVLVAGTVSGGSDERLKKNWRGVVSGFIEKLSQVKAGIFDRIDADITQPGVSAQSLQEVLPEAVLTGEDGMLSVNYGGAALLSVIELAKEVVALRAEIEALKAK
jgi:Chaperone of endosialidase